MPHDTHSGDAGAAGGRGPDERFEEIADELYGLTPEEFIPARDAAVATAKERGERDLAKAIGRLRRPTKAAWLANLLARYQPDQLDGLFSLAAGLAEAQRSLDGDALRALSAQRHRLVAAMAREAGRIARSMREPVSDSLLRELQGILDAALADPAIADVVRAGRLTRTVSWSGFGTGAAAAEPSARPVAPPPPRRPRPAPAAEPAPAQDRDEQERAERERAEHERRERERAARAEALAKAEEEESAARRRQDDAESAHARAEEQLDHIRDRVTELVAALEVARREEQAAADAVRDAAADTRAAARELAAASARTARARARLEELDET